MLGLEALSATLAGGYPPAVAQHDSAASKVGPPQCTTQCHSNCKFVKVPSSAHLILAGGVPLTWSDHYGPLRVIAGAFRSQVGRLGPH